MSFNKHWKAQSSRKVWRERSANTYQQHAVVQDSTDASKNVSSIKDAENARQGNKRSFKSILLAGSDGTVSGQRGKVPCGEASKSNVLPNLAMTDADQMDRTQRSLSSAEDASVRARWSDISESVDAMSESESAGMYSNSVDADAVSVSESTQTGGMDSSSTDTVGSQKGGVSDSMPTDGEASPLLLPSSCFEESPEGVLELPASELIASPYLETCGIATGVCTPDELEQPELWPNEQICDVFDMPVGEGPCYWVPWNPALVTAPDEAVPQDQQQEDVSQVEDTCKDAFQKNQSGSGSNKVQWVVTDYMPVTSYMPVMKMVEACPQQDPHTEENLPQPMCECYLPLDGTVPLTEDAMSESLINWKLDQACSWSEDEHQQLACTSALPWSAVDGENEIFFGEYDSSDYCEGMWYQEMPDVVDDASMVSHCVQAARAVANAQAMRANTWAPVQCLDDGSATAASSTDAYSVLANTDGVLRGLRAPVHGNVPRSRDFAAESRPEEHQEITTLMIRNIPNRYKRSTLMRELDHLGFTGKYDFLYIPVDRGTSWNVGYAFVNFFTPEWARDCMEMLQDHTFLQCKNGVVKCAQVSEAHMQGYEKNVQYYRSCAVHSARECQRPFIIEERVSLERASEMVRQYL